MFERPEHNHSLNHSHLMESEPQFYCDSIVKLLCSFCPVSRFSFSMQLSHVHCFNAKWMISTHVPKRVKMLIEKKLKTWREFQKDQHKYGGGGGGGGMGGGGQGRDFAYCGGLR